MTHGLIYQRTIVRVKNTLSERKFQRTFTFGFEIEFRLTPHRKL